MSINLILSFFLLPPANSCFGENHYSNLSFAMLCFYKLCTSQLHHIFQPQMPLVPPLNKSMLSPWNSSILIKNTRGKKQTNTPPPPRLPSRISHLLPTATHILLVKKKNPKVLYGNDKPTLFSL